MEKRIKTLNAIVSDELGLLLETWNYHWNVEGANFPSLHKLFEDQYDGLQELIDELAERVRALGGVAETKVSVEFSSGTPVAKMLSGLAERHEGLSAKMGKKWIPALDKEGDVGSVDLLTRALQLHDKMAWMLRATAK
ncbi:MAG TPA: DNA starvation/stationary phase protection protein [Paludibaculum sp.]